MVGEPKKKFQVPQLRSRSADSKQNNAVKKGIYSVVSKSLPNMGKKVDDKLQRRDSKTSKKKRKKKKGESVDGESVSGKKKKTAIIKQPKEDTEKKEKKEKERAQQQSRRTIWRHITWLVVLFAYSLLGGMAFSAIEGNFDRTLLLAQYEKEMDVYRRRRNFQSQIFRRFRDIDRDVARYDNKKDIAALKLELMRDALTWYERRLGVRVVPPVMEDTKWTIWGGIYYSASLYTTIGYGDFHPSTTAGRIMSMMYAAVGIPLVFTILTDWGFLYFTWIEAGWNWLNSTLFESKAKKDLERRRERERIRRMGSEMSLHSMSTIPLLSVNHTRDAVNQTDHQMESNKPLKELDVSLAPGEQKKTVPLKAALLFFVAWLFFSAFIVRLWEVRWSFFTAFYFFFNSLTTIGLGDVTPETPNYIIFNLAMTLVGLSVVGLCVAIIQAKVRLVFDRMIRSIDSQYRIRQIDPDVATMTLIPDEKEGIKSLMEAQSLQDRFVCLAMDEHKRQMLEERWKSRSEMVNRVVQTYPQRADKFVQTGNRVYDQPGAGGEDGDFSGGEWADSDASDASSDSEEEEESEEVEYDAAGNKLVPPSNKRYIYTVYDF